MRPCVLMPCHVMLHDVQAPAVPKQVQSLRKVGDPRNVATPALAHPCQHSTAPCVHHNPAAIS